MSISLSFRLYRLKALAFFWLFDKVSRVYHAFDIYSFKKYRLSPEVFSKSTLKLAHEVAEASCKSSGICAAKEWNYSNTVDEELKVLAWKAKQEVDPEDLDAYNDVMSKIQTVRELTPAELERAAAAMYAINHPDGEEF